MKNQRILIYNPAPLFPVKAMNQMRTYHMLKVLSQDFQVDLMTPIESETDLNLSKLKMLEIGGQFIGLEARKKKSNLLKKRLVQLVEHLKYYLFGLDREYSTNKSYHKVIIDKILKGNYKVVISNYWESSGFFADLPSGIVKILDPHYAVMENFDVLNRNPSSRMFYKIFEKRRLKRNLKMERYIINLSDIVLPLSKRNDDELKKIDPYKLSVLIPDGNDLDYYFSVSPNPNSKTILFYGAMSSQQNQNAFWRLFYHILPLISEKVSGLKLIVLGANPPESIKKLHNNKSVIVTGYVEDVRTVISKANLCIIPLEFGSGFRGRVIELMAMGIPVIGTKNALESVEIQHGINGFISDNNTEMAKYAITLIENPELRNTISNNAIEFVKKKYSLNATFRKLNIFLKEYLKVDAY